MENTKMTYFVNLVSAYNVKSLELPFSVLREMLSKKNKINLLKYIVYVFFWENGILHKLGYA